MSSAVGAGNLVIIHPVKHNRGNARAPMSAGIQNSLTWSEFRAYSPSDLATPELSAMLTPMMLARKSVVRLPSKKLKITPHIHPNESPLKNKAMILKGMGSNPKANKEISESAAEPIMNFNLPSGFNSEMYLIPKSLANT